MFTYNWYQDTNPTHCISNLYFKKPQSASSRKQRFSSADTVLFRVLAAAPQTTQYSLILHHQDKAQMLEKLKQQAHSDKAAPRQGAHKFGICVLAKPDTGEQPTVAVPGEFHTSPKKRREAKGEKTKPIPKPLHQCVSSHSSAPLHQNEFFHECSCMTISPSAEQAGTYQRNNMKHQADLILPSSLLHCYFPRK